MTGIRQPGMVLQPSTSSAGSSEEPQTPAIRFAHRVQAGSPIPEDTESSHYGSVERLQIPTNEDTSRDSNSKQTSPEPTQTDLQGHYIGPSSGVSFLLRVQRRLHENSSLSHDSSIFTFGDLPFPECDTTFFVLPPKADAQRLVERYFDFAAPTHRFLHRPTVENSLHEFYETQGEMRHKEDAASRAALLLMVMAQGKAYMPPSPNDHDKSVRYYFAAENQLAKERGSVRLASVQTRLVQCYYLLAQSRVNQCWSLFGTTAQLALALGLNRSRRADAGRKVDLIELESRRRTFWSVYVLDKFIAAALGRPRTFRDEDIDQELPTIVNDDDLLPHTIRPSTSKTQSIMMAPVEHIKLCRIVESVLRDLYPIRPPSMPLRIELAAKYSHDLRKWRARLSRFLDAEGVDSSLLIPLYQRQRNVLNLAYYHTMLLVHRPFLLSNFASLANIDARPGNEETSNRSIMGAIHANIDDCLEAAMGIVRIVDDIFQSSQIFRAFWFTQYYAFCAVVVLYIYRIQQHIVEPGKCDSYFEAGQRCQAQLSTLSESDCLSKRYCLVLEELRLEAARQTNREIAPLPTIPLPTWTSSGSRALTQSQSQSQAASQSISATDTTHMHPALPSATTAFSMPQTHATAQADGITSQDASAAPFSSAFYTGPQSNVFGTWMGDTGFMEDLTSWGQFDSLVTAGIGVLDGSGFQGDGM